jgi:hypothetical protein
MSSDAEQSTEELFDSDSDNETKSGKLDEHHCKREKIDDPYRRFNELSSKYQAAKDELRLLKRRAILQETINIGLVEPFTSVLSELSCYASPLAQLIKTSIQELLDDNQVKQSTYGVRKTIFK